MRRSLYAAAALLPGTAAFITTPPRRRETRLRNLNDHIDLLQGQFEASPVDGLPDWVQTTLEQQGLNVRSRPTWASRRATPTPWKSRMACGGSGGGGGAWTSRRRCRARTTSGAGSQTRRSNTTGYISVALAACPSRAAATA